MLKLVPKSDFAAPTSIMLWVFCLGIFLSCSFEKPSQPLGKGDSSGSELDSKGLNAKAHRLEQPENTPTTPNTTKNIPPISAEDLPKLPADTTRNTPAPTNDEQPSEPPSPQSQEPSNPPGNQIDPIAQLHLNQPPECATCHEGKRPSLAHYPKNDCVMCHKYPSFKGATFLHEPKPLTCESCHMRPQTTGLRSYPLQGPPAGFNPNDPQSIGGGHYRGKDCVECHQTKKEGASAFMFSHSKPNPGACLPCHYNQGFNEHRNSQNVTFTGSGNCNSCHKNFDVKVLRDFEPGN